MPHRRSPYLLALLAGYLLAHPGWAAPDIGSEVAPFTLPLLADEPATIASAEILPGHTTLLSFFATWCKPCKKEIPELRALAQRHADRGFRMVLVSLDHVSVDEVRRFVVDAGGEGLPVLWDEYGDVMAEFGIMKLPTNVVVGPSGTVQFVWEGYQPERQEALAAYLERLPLRPRAPAGNSGQPSANP